MTLARQEQERTPGSALGRWGKGVALGFASLVLHALAVVGGLAWSTLHPPQRPHERVTIIIHEREKPAEPLPAAPAPEPEEPETKEAPPRPSPPKAVQPEPPEPPPPVKPLRVVGLSLEATSEGGDGPAFAVGNTRAGQTEELARAVPSEPLASVPAAERQVSTAQETPNRTATRIPMAGVQQVLPKRARPVKPEYPVALKSQGLEGDVSVMVSLDATGKVTAVKLIAPSPHEAFNEAARSAAWSEQFEPATRNGVPVPYMLTFTYRFRLEG